MSEASLPSEEPADLVLGDVAFARITEGRIAARGTAQELTYRRSGGRLVASGATLVVTPREGSELASMGLIHLAAPHLDADTSAHRGEGSQGVRFDSERGDRGRADRVVYDGPKDLITSESTFVAQGPGYRVRSHGFVARADGSDVKLFGGVAGTVAAEPLPPPGGASSARGIRGERTSPATGRAKKARSGRRRPQETDGAKR